MIPRHQDSFPRLGEGRVVRLRHWQARRPQARETDWARMGISVYELRGSGRGAEALRLWTDYLFRESTWRRLDYSTWSGNWAMVRVGEKLGSAVEARFREARVVRGEVFDSVVLGILRREWEAQPDEE